MTSMQTPQPLPEIQVGTLNMPMTTFLNWDDRERGRVLDMEQPYQRGDVWGVVRRRNLVRSMLMGVPVPSVIINDRFSAKFRESGYTRDRKWAYAVVDGKQRITTVLMFLRDEFAIPASWLPEKDYRETEDTEDGPYVRFSMMTGRGQNRIEMAPMGVCMGKFPTLAEEKALFDLVNFGGVPQGERDSDA